MAASVMAQTTGLVENCADELYDHHGTWGPQVDCFARYAEAILGGAYWDDTNTDHLLARVCPDEEFFDGYNAENDTEYTFFAIT